MKISFGTKTALTQIVQKLNKLSEQHKEASDFIAEIKKGKLDLEISDNLRESELGTALISMREHLNNIAIEEKERTWTNEGLAKFSDILRNKNSLGLTQLTDDILKNLVKYLNANQGAVFVLENVEVNEPYLQMLACYAYDRKKFLEKRIALGEGLVGQCVLEKEPIYMTVVPQNYTHITSGLGYTTPKSVYISPLIINESIFGVLELASLEKFNPTQISFIQKLSENIASTIKNVKDGERTLNLLHSSQQQAEELRAQEEEVRQNMEELQATQEEMERKSNELSTTLSEMNGLLQGINATMATIEFTSDGKVLTANNNFLRVMKYSLEEIKGEHHRKFVPREILNTDDYKIFWKKLGAGESKSGIFKRIDSEGKIIWLNAIYNPILNANGDVTKVVKFATDITEQQEALAESKGILNGINATMATIEFKPDGTIINANDKFLNKMGYSLEAIKRQHHKKFVPEEIQKSEEYKTFWKRLAGGEPITGVFERVNSTGETVWLSAIYNPILNANGEVFKIVKFATDVTNQYSSTEKKRSKRTALI